MTGVCRSRLPGHNATPTNEWNKKQPLHDSADGWWCRRGWRRREEGERRGRGGWREEGKDCKERGNAGGGVDAKMSATSSRASLVEDTRRLHCLSAFSKTELP